MLFFSTSNFLSDPAPPAAKRPLWLACAALCSSLCSGLALAQQAELAAPRSAEAGMETQLGEVTVSASPQASGDLTQPTLVLDREQLQRRQAATWGETLAGEAGISASHFGAGASRPIVRGMDGARVSILSDGAEIQDASTVSPDHAVSSEPFLSRQAELLRGPSALLYGASGSGGIVNILDDKIATEYPDRNLQGSAMLQAGTAAREKTGAFSLTGATRLPQSSLGLVLHAEGLKRDTGDYRVGSGWGQARVPGSFNRTDTGSLGLSLVGNAGYVGIAYTRQTARYGLPGHNHGIEDCHVHGTHLHCGGHDHDHASGEDGHDHAAASVPVVDLASERWDLRGQWNQPVAGIAAVRVRGGWTRYRHDEIEDGTVATTFKNRAHDLRLEVDHEPLAGWRGTLGLQTTDRRFSAIGKEAYVQPTDTRRDSFFWLEQYQSGAWRWQAALRHERQSVEALESGLTRRHSATALSLGSRWNFATGYEASAAFTSGSRLPTAEELFAHGLHMAPGTYELGNADLRRERSRSLELALARTAGATTWRLSAYHYRINDFIYGATLDAVEGLQLLQYTQANARFTGWEAQVSQKLGTHLKLTAFGDGVRARLADGSPLPRIPALRAGLRLAGEWGNWQTQAEWVQVLRQNRVAQYETQTPGYGMFNLYAAYTLRSSGGPQGTKWQLYVKGQNLTNRLAYASTSFIKTAAPLMGRNLIAGVRMDF